MAINPLPEATIHLLGSSQVLTSATSLVKELVDNALDAKATSIDVLISQNTLDKIEVRDNGHGIPFEDLDLLGRRGHTSKIKSFDDVTAVAGISLGFRGEALSSAVQLADVRVTTRTDGESVATCVTLKVTGGVDKQSRTSHPVGTTVSVKHFMEKLPVRKQTALKETPKTLMKIKDLLQGYALARPSIRFALRIAKSSKGGWSFSPRPKDGLREVISLLFGRELAIQCMETVMEFPQISSSEVITEDSTEMVPENDAGLSKAITKRFTIEAFLPKPNADPAKCSHGQYISIDSRPVSCEKGTMRRIVVMYKTYLKSAFSNTSDIVKNPFLRLNIKCPLGTYDPNVEPSKDDILFSNEGVVLGSMEKLFESVYGQLNKEADSAVSRQKFSAFDNFELLLARNSNSVSNMQRTPRGSRVTERLASHPLSTSLVSVPEGHRRVSPLRSSAVLNVASEQDPEVSSNPTTVLATLPSETDEDAAAKMATEETTRTTRRRWDCDMSRDFSESVQDAQVALFQKKLSALECDRDEEATDSGDYRAAINPWVIAKMTAPSSTECATSMLSSVHKTPNVRSRAILIPTPSTSSNRTASDSESHQTHQIMLKDSHESNYSTPTSISRRANDFILARDLVSAPAHNSLTIMQHGNQSRLSGQNRPFVSPLTMRKGSIAADYFVQTTLPDHVNPRMPVPESDFIPSPEPDTELAWAMNFEKRKEDATRCLRQEVRATRREKQPSIQPIAPRTSPHKNRYNSAIAALESVQPTSRDNGPVQEPKEPLKTTLSDDDPRAYLMRQKESINIQAEKPEVIVKPRRAKSARLPLETVPAGKMLHNLALNVQVDTNSLKKQMASLLKKDKYACGGVSLGEVPMVLTDKEVVSQQIDDVVKKWIQGRKELEVEYTWKNLVTTE